LEPDYASKIQQVPSHSATASRQLYTRSIMKLELQGAIFPIMGAKSLTSYLLFVGIKAKLKPNIKVDGGGDVDDDGCKRDLELIAAIDNFKLQLRRRSHSEVIG